MIALLLVSGCQFLPPELRSLKSPIRLSPLKHEVTVQPAPRMGAAPFTIDQATAGAAEVKLTVSNPTASAIRIIWADATFIAADSIIYAVGIKTDRDVPSTASTTIEPNGTLRMTVLALSKDGKPVTPGDKSIDAPYRVGLRLSVERGFERWKGTVWVFVS